jgi:hypothetical protein
MTREEEIKRGAKYNANGTTDDVLAEMYFIRGAEWADEHPKEVLWDSEKVISFLKEHATVENSCNINIHINGATYHFVNDFIEDLRKAMEEIR